MRPSTWVHVLETCWVLPKFLTSAAEPLQVVCESLVFPPPSVCIAVVSPAATPQHDVEKNLFPPAPARAAQKSHIPAPPWGPAACWLLQNGPPPTASSSAPSPAGSEPALSPLSPAPPPPAGVSAPHSESLLLASTLPLSEPALSELLKASCNTAMPPMFVTL